MVKIFKAEKFSVLPDNIKFILVDYFNPPSYQNIVYRSRTRGVTGVAEDSDGFTRKLPK